MQQGQPHVLKYDTRDDAALLMQFKQRLLDPPFEVIQPPIRVPCRSTTWGLVWKGSCRMVA